MPITVKHLKVSTVPDAGDDTLVEPSDWNADHTLTGLGTMAEQNANAVAITGGTISGVTIPASNVTGTLGVANGGTGASTLTGYVKGAGTTPLTASATIPNTDITGLGTASTKDAGAALGVATLDAGGKVPVSELPAAVLGALSYQGTWDASTNTPTLTSSVGTKGYYYVVSVAGNTNLNGITDWLVGDWAVYNGTVWQKVDNTETVTSVNGQIGAVVLTTTNIAEGTNLYYTDARARAAISAGTGISYDNATGVVTNAAPDQTVALTDGTAIDVTGTYPNFTINNTAPDQTVVLTAGTGISTSGTYPNFTITNTSPSLGGDVVGPTGATDNAVARYDTTTGKLIQNSLVIIDDTGSVTGVNALTAQSLTVNNNATFGTSNSDTINFVGRINSDFDPATDNTYDLGRVGHEWRDLYIDGTANIDSLIADTADINAGTIDNTTIGATTPQNGSFVNLSVTGTTSFDGSQGTSGQVLTSAGTGNTPTWTTPTTGTVTSVAATAGTGISITGSPITTSGTLNITNTAPDQVVSLTGAGTTSISGTYPNFTVTSNDQFTGTVTSVTGTAPVVSSGGNTPAISMAQATGSVDGYLSATDWTTFNSKAPAVTYTTNYVPFGQGTTTPNQNANFTFDGTTQTAPIQRASNGIIVNSQSISASYTIAATDNAVSVGPVTIASGQTVTVSSGSRWVVL